VKTIMWGCRSLSLLFVALACGMVACHEMDASEMKPTSAKQAKVMLQRSLNAGPNGFHEVPNFVVAHRSFRVEVKSRIGCQNVCQQHDSCRSFSYRAGDKRCLWSKEALKYDSKFVFYMKVTKMNDMGKMIPTGQYKRFDNFAYREKGWQKIVAGMSGCRDFCNKMEKCGSFSFREHDTLCLLSDDSVKYDTDWNYYERNMPKKKKKKSLKAKIMLLKDARSKISIPKTKRVLRREAKKGLARVQKLSKKVESAKGDESRAAAEQAKQRAQMHADIKERTIKSDRNIAISRATSLTARVQHIGRRASKEAKSKATSKIHNAFQEGYMKAEEKNRAGYEKTVKEIAFKGREAFNKHAEKAKKEAAKKEKIMKEKRAKEKKKKEVKKKLALKEQKSKAERKVQVDSIKVLAKQALLADQKSVTNERKTKIVVAVNKQRIQREAKVKKKKEKLIKKKRIQHEKDQKKAKKERVKKVHHEAQLKEEQKATIAYARKQREQTNKEIMKKSRIFERRKKLKEREGKLTKAKANAAELKAKHKERASKIGQCKERRVKGKFITYAYAREAAFTDAAAAATKFGADVSYNGMLRVQNGLGNRKQHAYIKFSAKGNKIIDEASETLLGESDQFIFGKRKSFFRSSMMKIKAKELIQKGKRGIYVARRRYVDRRRRWAAPKITAARRRSVLSSRRRAIVERRRRSTAVLESAVTSATLKVFKFGGPAAKLTVKATSCGWHRPTISYGNAAKLAIPVSWAEDALVATSLLQEGETANLSSEDTVQRGYWKKKIKVTPKGTDYNRRRRAPVPRKKLPPIPYAKPYVPSRRRYVDRRRRMPIPKKTANRPPTTSAPNPTARRRRFVGKTTGTVFAPSSNNVWLAIKLSPNIVGVMRSKDKMCFEITGGGPVQPIILGSEKSTNKPHLIMNIKGQGGARRRRCSQVVGLQALTAKKKGTKTGSKAKVTKAVKKKRL